MWGDDYRCLSGGALRHRHTEPGHPVEHRAGDPGFGLLAGQSPSPKAPTDDGLVAEHGGFPERAPAVADRLLPAHAALVPDHPDVPVALAGRGAGGRGRPPWGVVGPGGGISPLPGSPARGILRQLRRPRPPCFSTSHSPAPCTFSPVASITTWTGPVLGACASDPASARPGLRRERVVWSGMPIPTPSRVASERSRPSVCRQGRPKARRSRCPVSIAIVAYCGDLPRRPVPGGCQAARADRKSTRLNSSHTVISY